jgi:hypothetical protein
MFVSSLLFTFSLGAKPAEEKKEGEPEKKEAVVAPGNKNINK